MTEQEILKFGEIQYLKGRLDELHKALPNITNLDRRRRIDQRIEKYINKLKRVDEVAYRLYEVELIATTRVKNKGKQDIKDLLQQILINENIMNEDILQRINDKIESL
jgi:ferritin-like metal-binding protein YciE